MTTASNPSSAIGNDSATTLGDTPQRLTPAMLRELRSIERGDIGDLLDYGQNSLAFYARDRVIGALERRGLIEANPDWSLTDAGRAALKAALA